MFNTQLVEAYRRLGPTSDPHSDRDKGMNTEH